MRFKAGDRVVVAHPNGECPQMYHGIHGMVSDEPCYCAKDAIYILPDGNNPNSKAWFYESELEFENKEATMSKREFKIGDDVIIMKHGQYQSKRATVKDLGVDPNCLWVEDENKVMLCFTKDDLVLNKPVEEKKSGGDAEYLKLLDRLREMHIAKSTDYGDGEDPLQNLRATEELGIPPWIGCMVRLADKLARVKSLIRNGSLKCESIEDNLADMASYSLLALRLIREKKAVKA